jgi:hypothetical protein
MWADPGLSPSAEANQLWPRRKRMLLQLPEAYTDEGHLAFCATVFAPCRDSPYKRECTRRNDRMTSYRGRGPSPAASSPWRTARTSWTGGCAQQGSVALSLGTRIRSHCRFRNSGTEYDRESGMKWMRGGTKRQCDRALSWPVTICRANSLM